MADGTVVVRPCVPATTSPAAPTKETSPVFGSKKKQRVANLMENGSLAVGTILNVRDTGTTVNNAIRIDMRFRIDPLDGSAPFEASKKKLMPRTAIPQPGQRYPVWYDAEDHESWAFATSDGGAEARAQIVQIFGDKFGPDGSGVGQVAAAAPAPVAAAATDPLDRIAKLDQLRTAGALTDAEYDAQKQRILAEL
jgi:hypothetical protein